MKLPRTIVALFLLLSFSFVRAQVSDDTDAKTPDWGVPATTERYYYIPDIQTYYDISTREYIYLNDGIWTRSATVPAIYRNYDFYRGRKILIDDYSGNAPYAFYNVHRVKYVPARPQKGYVQTQSATRGRSQGNSYTRGNTNSRSSVYSRPNATSRSSATARGNSSSRGNSSARTNARR